MAGGDNMKFREIESIILSDGWVYEKCRGSHMQYIHPTKKGRVTIPKHSGDIPKGTINSIMKQAGLK